MTYSHDIKKLLGIKDPNIMISEDCTALGSTKLNGIKYQIVKATLSYTPEDCPKCHQENLNHSIHKHGFKLTKIKFACSTAEPKLIYLNKQRFKCLNCHQTFTAQTSLVEPGHQISNLQKDLIKDQLALTQSFSLIARNCYVSVNTVIRLMDSLGPKLKQTFHYLPQALSFDEVRTTSSCKAGLSFIYADATTHKVLNLLDSRQQHDVMEHFYHYSLAVRRQVKWITMDMNMPYVKVIQDLFPNAEIVIDRFHIVQLLNRALNKLRIEVMYRIKKLKRNTDYTKFKRLWKLILKNRDELDTQHYRPHPLFLGNVSEASIVEYLLSLDDGLRKAYDTVNDLKYEIRAHNPEQFRQDLFETRKYTYRRVIRTALNTLFKYREGIENALVVTLSNGHLEASNNLIKTIKRTGHGYRNFNRLRLRILYMTQRRDSSKKQQRPLYFTEEASLIAAS